MSLYESLNQCSWLTLALVGVGFYWGLKKLIERIRVSDPKQKAIFITNCDFEIGQEIALRCAQHGFLVFAGFSKLEVCEFVKTKILFSLESQDFGKTIDTNQC